MALVLSPSILKNMINVLYTIPQASFVFNMNFLKMVWDKPNELFFFLETSEWITQMCLLDIKFLLLSPLVSVKFEKWRSRKLSRTWQPMINERS